MEETELDVIDPFGGWSGKPQDSLKTQFMFSFLDETDENQAFYQDGYKVNVWTGFEDNALGVTEECYVNTPAFELVGAVQMTVAATSAIAFVLLF